MSRDGSLCGLACAGVLWFIIPFWFLALVINPIITLPATLVLIAIAVPVYKCVACCCSGPDEERYPSRPSRASLVSPLLAEQVEDWMRAPRHWTNQDLRTDFDERYKESSQISQHIEELMSETWRSIVTRDRTGSPPRGLKFIYAQRIEDRKMWMKYLRAKEMVRSKHGGTCTPLASLPSSGPAKTMRGWQNDPAFAGLDPSVNEMFLWHGTSYEGAMGISEDGFDLSKCGKNGLMFGRGVYLAECCSKSDEYSTNDQPEYQGLYALLLCRACLGEIFQVERADQRSQRAILDRMTFGNYETVLGDREKSVNTYREFVPYSSDLVYPEYVVIYKRVYEDEQCSSTLEP